MLNFLKTLRLLQSSIEFECVKTKYSRKDYAIGKKMKGLASGLNKSKEEKPKIDKNEIESVKLKNQYEKKKSFALEPKGDPRYRVNNVK